MPPRRVRVNGRPGTPVAAPVSRARARERAPHLRPVPADAATAATLAAAPTRPVRGGTTRNVIGAPAAPATKTATFKKLRTPAMPKVQLGAFPLRRITRVVYNDAVDGWIVRTPAPSIAEVFNFEYAVPGDYAPFRVWCKVYTRSLGVLFASAFDGAKWVLIHPVRGPLAMLGAAAAITVPQFI
jgi:hypothetical protein